MSNKNKLIPKRRFKEFENAEAWEQRKLGEVFDQTVEYVNPKLENIELWSVTVESGLTPKTERYNREALVKKEDKFKLVHPGDVVYNPMNMTIGAVGMNQQSNSIAVSGYYVTMRLRENFNGFYFFEWLSSDRSMNLFRNHATGSLIEKQRVQFPTLSNIDAYVPEFLEQKNIGQFFQRLDKLITLHQRKLNKLEEIKAAYLNEMFPIKGEFKPKRRFSGFEEDWNWIPLKEIGNTFTGLSGKTKEDFGHGDAKFITYMNVFSNPISDLNGLENIEIDKKQSQVNYGDVLFTTSSETPEEVGMSSVWLGNEEDVYLNSFCFGFRPSVEIDKYYLAYMLRSAPIRKKFQILAQGISRYNISKNKVMEISIPLPCMDEQKKIGLLFKNIEQTIYSQKKTVEKLRNLKNAYLNEMFV